MRNLRICNNPEGLPKSTKSILKILRLNRVTLVTFYRDGSMYSRRKWHVSVSSPPRSPLSASAGSSWSAEISRPRLCAPLVAKECHVGYITYAGTCWFCSLRKKMIRWRVLRSGSPLRARMPVIYMSGDSATDWCAQRGAEQQQRSKVALHFGYQSTPNGSSLFETHLAEADLQRQHPSRRQPERRITLRATYVHRSL